MTATAYRYRLDSGGKKHPCPNCGKRRFVRYVDTQTGEKMPEQFGRCDREQNCSYHSKPERQSTDTFHRVKMPPPPPPSLMQPELMAASVARGNSSAFARWMAERFGDELAADAAKRYHLGASKHWQGANVFWQVDTNGNIHGGKVMQFDATGHRVKVPTNRVTWVHSVLKLEGYNLRQCFFGEHLLAERPSDPVGIVESEKTAIVASMYIPEMVWIATGGKYGCKWKNDASVHTVLSGRNVTLFPDLGAFNAWSEIATSIMSAKAIAISDLLEKNATENEREQGLDLADYLIKFDFKAFAVPEPPQPAPVFQPIGAVVLKQRKNSEKQTQSRHSDTITPQANIMPLLIDWAQLEQPEPWELNPF